MGSKRMFDWSEKITPCQTWLERRFSWNENLQQKQKWIAKSTNLEENAGKIETVFVIRAALWAESLDFTLNIAGFEKVHWKRRSVNSSFEWKER